MDKRRKPEPENQNSEAEEKIKRMLDPSLPDEPRVDTATNEASSAKNSITIQPEPALTAIPPKETKIEVDVAPSAPELPNNSPTAEDSDKNTALLKKSKKVIIPISHDNDLPADVPKDELEPKQKQILNQTEPTNDEQKPTPSPQKITISHDESPPEDLADKLDKTIAELDASTPSEEASETAELEEVVPPAEKAETTTPDAPDQEIVISDPKVINDPSTDKAIDEIVAAESDEIIEIEDAIRDTDEPIKKPAKQRRNILQILKSLWAKPGFRRAMVAATVLLIFASALVPGSRYFLLNTVGVRSNSSLIVLDKSTQQPLKNVSVTIGNVSSLSDQEGRVNLSNVKLGSSVLKIEKRAFAVYEGKIIIGLGSNPLGDYSLVPTGSQYNIKITDYLSGKPIAKAEASTGEASAVSDENGDIKLTIDAIEDNSFEVKINSPLYREELLSVDPNDKTVVTARMVPVKKQFFVSKRSGLYDIYSIFIDGSDEKLVLAGSGKEKDNMVLVPHPSANVIAYVSTRAGQNNKDGYLLSNLILINTQDSTTTNIGASERIQIISWSGDYLLYVMISEGGSANSPNRYRLMSYNYLTSTSKELASSNYFNDVNAVNDIVYYAPASAFQASNFGLYQTNPDGTVQRKVFDQEVWNIIRTDYQELALSVQQEWYKFNLGENAPIKINSAPTNQLSRVYVNSPDSKQSAWVDVRDGKGVVLSYDNSTKTDKVIVTQSGIKNPINWLNNTILVYRVKTDQEIADYAVNVEGGEPVKIRDVTNSGGLDNWFY